MWKSRLWASGVLSGAWRRGRLRVPRGPLAGILEALGIPVLFAAGGTLGYALLLGSSYLPLMAEASRRLWLVDGYNTLSAGILGGEDRSRWWRGACRERLLERSSRFREAGAEVWVVFDGGDPSGSRVGVDDHPKIVFAPDADAWLAARVRGSHEPQHVSVVTNDRRLAGRLRGAGAEVVSPADFLHLCDV